MHIHKVIPINLPSLSMGSVCPIESPASYMKVVALLSSPKRLVSVYHYMLIVNLDQDHILTPIASRLIAVSLSCDLHLPTPPPTLHVNSQTVSSMLVE